MKLICVSCGGFKFFEVEVEALKAIEVNDDGLIIDDAIFSDDVLRENLDRIVNYVLEEPNETTTDAGNEYITCARCSSRNVVVPSVKWNPPLDPISIDDELKENRNEYISLRKERHRENYLPVLFQ